ncbi:uncharacterized protein [Haliotis cracherodii]|uniref:uncharacterized protein n=1 Tax=Haliotis cracherodii TaxID=6455 RepID=UPI0039E8BAF2
MNRRGTRSRSRSTRRGSSAPTDLPNDDLHQPPPSIAAAIQSSPVRSTSGRRQTVYTDIPSNLTTAQLKSKLRNLGIQTPNMTRKDLVRLLEANEIRRRPSSTVTSDDCQTSDGVTFPTPERPLGPFSNMAAPTITSAERSSHPSPQSQVPCTSPENAASLQNQIQALQRTVESLSRQIAGNPSRASDQISTFSAQETTRHPNTLFEVPRAGPFGRATPISMPLLSTAHRDLSQDAQRLMDAGVAPSTLQAYSTGLSRFKLFLLLNGFEATKANLPPLTENRILLFITHCHSKLQLQYSTIKLYLAGVKFFYVRAGRYQEVSQAILPDRVQLLLRGIKKSQGKPKLTRLPITTGLLKQMCCVLRKGCFTPFVDCMMEAACTLAFFAFLRCSEFTVRGSFDPAINLCLSDVNVNAQCTRADIKIKASKTDPFKEGVVLQLYANKCVCPVRALVKYINMRSKCFQASSQAFFLDELLRPLTRDSFQGKLKHVINLCGVPSANYNTHSFRIGAATMASKAQVEDHMIQTLGRWSSQAYLRYIHVAQESIKNAQVAMSNC